MEKAGGGYYSNSIIGNDDDIPQPQPERPPQPPVDQVVVSGLDDDIHNYGDQELGNFLYGPNYVRLADDHPSSHHHHHHPIDHLPVNVNVGGGGIFFGFGSTTTSFLQDIDHQEAAAGPRGGGGGFNFNFLTTSATTNSNINLINNEYRSSTVFHGPLPPPPRAAAAGTSNNNILIDSNINTHDDHVNVNVGFGGQPSTSTGGAEDPSSGKGKGKGKAPLLILEEDPDEDEDDEEFWLHESDNSGDEDIMGFGLGGGGVYGPPTGSGSDHRSSPPRPPPAVRTWPPTPLVPYDCHSCQVLRRIIHTNGMSNVTRLEIHGRIDLISHAIIEVHARDTTTGELVPLDIQVSDLSRESMGDIKELLKQYIVDRIQAGFVLQQEPLAPFYQTMYVGLDSLPGFRAVPFSSLLFDHRPGPPTAAPPLVIRDPLMMPPPPPLPPTISNITEKKKRVAEMTFEDFAPLFHLPVKEVTKLLDLADSTIKRKLRELGVSNWPCKKVTILNLKIREIEAELARLPNNHERRAQAQQELKEYRRRLDQIYRRNITNNYNDGKHT